VYLLWVCTKTKTFYRAEKTEHVLFARAKSRDFHFDPSSFFFDAGKKGKVLI
jgi:hypothetical protein